jgi:hypothetical protein
MSFGDLITGLNSGTAALGNALFPSDPNVSGYVDPATAAAARNNSLITLGLGIMRAPYSMTGLGSGLLDAYQGAQGNYQSAMDRAFQHTLVKRAMDNQAQDREFQLSQREIQGKEAALGLKQAERADRTQAATVAQRVLRGLQSSQSPTDYLAGEMQNPDVQDAFKTLNLPTPYIGPMADPSNLEKVKGQLAIAAAGAPPPAPIKLSQGDVLLNPNDPSQVIASAAPKSTVEYKDAGDKLIPVNSVTGQPVAGLAPIPKSQTPTQEAKNFAPDESQLMGALAEQGVSLPAGLRSQQQMKSTFRGLIDRNPGKTPDQIADLVRTGQLDFNGAKKSTAQLMTQSAAANVQASKLEKDFAQLEPLVAKLPDAPNVINRALVGLKNNLSFGGDKDSAQLVLYMREAATEYAKLSSGSTGSAAPAEGNIKEAVEIFHKAFTEGGYQGLKEAMIKSAQNKRDAVQEGLRAASARGASTGNTPQGPTVTSGAPVGADGKPLW